MRPFLGRNEHLPGSAVSLPMLLLEPVAPLNPAVPKDVAELVAAREKDIGAGKLHPFQGPVKDNEGKERVAAGKTMGDEELSKMDFYVEGVQGKLPKK